MSFNYNSTGIQENEHKAKPIAPEGTYALVIEDATEGNSKKSNYPMIKLSLKIIEDAEYQGITFNHWVVFIPPTEKGANINVHFRKCIGVPYEGDVSVNADDWVGKKFKARLVIESLEGDRGFMRFNKIKVVEPYGDAFPVIDTSEVPF